MTWENLVAEASKVTKPKKLSPWADAGGVGAALLSASGTVYTGVCIDTCCSMGFCAEHAAAAAMVTAGEHRVVKMVAVGWDGQLMAPCGRCREFIGQLHEQNGQTEVLLPGNQVQTLDELMPWNWKAAESDAT